MSVKNDVAMKFSVLFFKEDKLWVGHCLELDIVATSTRIRDLKKEIGELIGVQVDYAFSNDNLENLYHPAPAEVWKKFYRCTEMEERKIKVPHEFTSKRKHIFVPSQVYANECCVG